MTFPTYQLHEVLPDGKVWSSETIEFPGPKGAAFDREVMNAVTGGFTGSARWATVDGVFAVGIAYCTVRGKGNNAHVFTKSRLAELLRCGDLEANPFPGVKP